MATIFKRFKRFWPLTNTTEILHPRTSEPSFVKTNASVWSLSRTNSHTNNIFYVIHKGIPLPHLIKRCVKLAVRSVTPATRSSLLGFSLFFTCFLYIFHNAMDGAFFDNHQSYLVFDSPTLCFRERRRHSHWWLFPPYAAVRCAPDLPTFSSVPPAVRNTQTAQC